MLKGTQGIAQPGPGLGQSCHKWGVMEEGKATKPIPWKRIIYVCSYASVMSKNSLPMGWDAVPRQQPCPVPRLGASALHPLEEVINSLTRRALTRPPRIDRILLSCNEFYGLFQYILAMFLQ